MSEAKIAAANEVKKFVTVACKLPHGLILRGGRMIKHHEPVMGGGTKEIEMWQATGDNVTIRGNAVPQGIPSQADLTGGFAMTTVDATFWENWMSLNKEHPAVKAGLIFAMPSLEQASDKARERSALLNGLERLHRRDDGVIQDPRVPRNVTGGNTTAAA